MIYVYIAIGVFLLIGVSIAGGASMHFWDCVKKRDRILSDISMTASDFAKDVLKQRKIPVTVVSTEGAYNDYYSSKAKQIAISEELYLSPTVVALGVTSHELGHAITDYEKNVIYRSHKILRRITSILNKLVYLILIASLVLFLFFEDYNLIAEILIYVVLGIFALSFLFKFLTIGNEREASKIGIELLKEYGMPKNEIKIVKKVLNAALLTYIGELFMPIVKVLRFFGKIFDATVGRLFR